MSDNFKKAWQAAARKMCTNHAQKITPPPNWAMTIDAHGGILGGSWIHGMRDIHSSESSVVVCYLTKIVHFKTRKPALIQNEKQTPVPFCIRNAGRTVFRNPLS
jgi:hypothetical protein